MNNIIPVVADIENILQGADSPEKTLYQRYCVSGDELRETFVLAMIGKLIEQNHRLQSGSRSHGNWMKW